MTFQGALYISSWVLAIGSLTGAPWFYGRFPLHVPHWVVFCVLNLPWAIVQFASFWRVPPLSPRAYRLTLIGVICWYTALVLGAEVGQHIWRLPPNGAMTVTAARCLMYFGCISFIPFALAIVTLRRFEKELSANGVIDTFDATVPGAEVK